MKSILWLTLAAILLLAPAGALADRRYTVRYGQTWDGHLADGVSRMANRAFVNRNLYRQYRHQMELLNQERLDRGLQPMPVKNFREWRKCQ